MRRARKKTFFNNTSTSTSHASRSQEDQKDFQDREALQEKQRTDSNALQVCTVKGSCPVPDVYNCQFTYGGYDSISMSSIGNYTGQYIYAANSLYDPLQSGGGNQPYYYDQLVAPSSGDSGLFKAWKVSASKIELELCAAELKYSPGLLLASPDLQ